MQKSAFIRTRIEPVLKVNAEHLLQEMGITPTQAITMLYKRITQAREWPLELKVPNAKTKKTFKETDEKIGLISCKNLKDMFKKLDI